jgi:site-specific recombinase XerD
MSGRSADARRTRVAAPAIGLLLPEAEALFRSSLVAKSPRTTDTYASSLRRFEEYLSEHDLDPNSVRVADLGETVLAEFQAWLIRGYGREDRATVATYVAGVRAFFRFLSQRHLLAPDVSFEAIREHARQAMARVPYRAPRVDARLPLVVLYVKSVPLPDPEKQRRAYFEVLRDRAIILTLFATGMRREEIARLDRADVEDGYATQAIIRGKGDRERVVFFSDEAREALRAYLKARMDEYVPVFIRHDRARGRPRGRGSNFRLSPLSVWATVKKYSRLAEVPISTHDFRHAKATVLLNQGAKLSEVQDILGHASPETTKKIYAHYEVAHLRAAFDRYSLSAEELAERLQRKG